MKFKIDDEIFDDASSVAYHITENMDDEVYDNMLNESYDDDVSICGCEYNQVSTWKEIDPTAYRCGKNDYYDALAQDMSSEIDRMDGYDSLEFYGFTVEALDEEYILSEIEDLQEEINDCKLDCEAEMQGIEDETEIAEIKGKYHEMINNLQNDINNYKEELEEFGIKSNDEYE